MIGAARFVTNTYTLACTFDDSLERCDSVMSINLRATSSHDARRLRVRANQRQRGQTVELKWKYIVFVPEQNNAFRCCFAGHCLMFRAIDGLFRLLVRMLEGAGPLDQAQQTAYAFINGRLTHLATFDSLPRFCTTPAF